MLKESFLDELFVRTDSDGSSVLEPIEISFLGVLDFAGFELVFRLFGIFGDDDLKRILL